MRSPILCATVAVLAAFSACDNGAGPNGSVARVEVNLAGPTVLVGTSAVANARAFDLNGTELTDRKVTWRATPSTTVRITSNGVYTGLEIGTATITATIGGVNGTASLTVVPLAVASVEITPVIQTLERGQSLQLRAVLRDQFGDTLKGRPVTWTSSAPGIVGVSGDGLITGIAAGDAEITASSENEAATISVTVLVIPAVGGPQIASITPDLLVPGVIATISGTDFGELADLNEVRVAGVLAPITSASATQIVVQLPLTGFGCNATRNVYVQVARGSQADAKQHPLQSVTLRTLQPGESLVFTSPADARCFELATTGGRYVISVLNMRTANASDTSFRLRGVQGLAVPGDPQPIVAAPIAAPVAAQAGPGGMSSILSAAAVRAEQDAHERILIANIEHARGGSGPSAGAVRAIGAGAVTAAQPVGSVLPFRIPNIGGFLSGGLNFCSNYFAVNARVAYNGSRAIIVEDTATTTPTGAPTLAGQFDSLYVKIGQEFDDVMFNVDRTWFADPLRMDDLLDNNGKIIMLFSPRVNSFSSVAGFVTTCDFDSRDVSPSSNRAEIFYAHVPLNPSPLFVGAPNYSRSEWYRTIRSTIVHEVKHIAAFSNRIRDFGRAMEEPWLEEGTARHAEEIWARTAAYNGLQQRANAGYATTLYCDVRGANTVFPGCVGSPYALYRHFTELYTYMSDNEIRSPLGYIPGVPESSFYGSAWALTRWAIDTHAGDEIAFLNGLVRTNLSGVANLTARVGRPWEELLADWSLALYADDLPDLVPANPRLTMPSWNYRSIFAGMNQDFPGTFPRSYPLRPRQVLFGDFTVTVTKLAGGTFSMFEVSGQQAGRQLIRLLGPVLDAPSNALRVAVMRAQ